MGATAQLLSVDGESVVQALNRLLETDRLVRDALAGITVIYLPELFEAEIYIKDRLLAAAHLKFSKERSLERMLSAAQRESGIAYSA